MLYVMYVSRTSRLCVSVPWSSGRMPQGLKLSVHRQSDVENVLPGAWTGDLSGYYIGVVINGYGAGVEFLQCNVCDRMYRLLCRLCYVLRVYAFPRQLLIYGCVGF